MINFWLTLRETAAVIPGKPVPQGGPLYVFGYGSLMWQPGFEPVSVHPARVIGWHRRFSRVSVTSWGNPDAPGLCAALHAGGSAWGRILRVSERDAESVLAYLDRRERAYARRAVHVHARLGDTLARLVALTYVADPSDPTLAPALDPDRAVCYARGGIGTKGASMDYIRSTMLALAEDGHVASDAHRFYAMIAR